MTSSTPSTKLLSAQSLLEGHVKPINIASTGDSQSMLLALKLNINQACAAFTPGLMLLIVLMMLAGVANNVGASMMSYVMPGFPSWLLYGTTIMYTMLFLCIAWSRGEFVFTGAATSWSQQKYFLILAVWTSANGVLFQFAAAWVDPDLSQVLASLSTPMTLVVSRWLLPDRQSVREWIGAGIVLLAVLVGCIPLLHKLATQGASSGNTSEQSNAWYWVLSFIFSTFFGALQYVYQQKAFRASEGTGAPKVCEATMLFYYNLYSLPCYLLVIPAEAVPYINGKESGSTLAEAFANQAAAFRCWAGHADAADVADGSCLPDSTLWPLIFVAGYAALFFLQAFTIKKYNDITFMVVLSAAIQPLSAFVFTSDALVGQANTQSLKAVTIVAFVMILVGVGIKGAPAEEGELEAKKKKEESAELEGVAHLQLQQDGGSGGAGKGGKTMATTADSGLTTVALDGSHSWHNHHRLLYTLMEDQSASAAGSPAAAKVSPHDLV